MKPQDVALWLGIVGVFAAGFISYGTAVTRLDGLTADVAALRTELAALKADRESKDTKISDQMHALDMTMVSISADIKVLRVLMETGKPKVAR